MSGSYTGSGLTRIDLKRSKCSNRGPEGKSEKLDFKETMVEAIADAWVYAAGKLIGALEREPAA